MAGADVDPNWNGQYAIDSDGAGDLPPFAVKCDFVSDPTIGITVVSPLHNWPLGIQIKILKLGSKEIRKKKTLLSRFTKKILKFCKDIVITQHK